MKSIGMVLVFILSFSGKLISNSAPVLSYNLHEFHLSKCLIDYNTEVKTLQISLYIFIDDLEEALRQQGADQLFICTKKEHAQAENYIGQYLQQHFILEVNGQEVNYSFLGKEVSDDQIAVWCFLEITGVEDLKKLKVSNNILMEVFDDQKNIININGPKNKKGFLLFDKGKYSETVKF